MNTQELIEALQKQDPNAPARDAIKAVNAAAVQAANAALVTPAGIKAAYAKSLAFAKTHKDSKGNGNDDPEACACAGVRSEVQAALQAASPPPGPHPDDEGDPEELHMRQKRHFKRLWAEANALVAAAGINEKGQVS